MKPSEVWGQGHKRREPDITNAIVVVSFFSLASVSVRLMLSIHNQYVMIYVPSPLCTYCAAFQETSRSFSFCFTTSEPSMLNNACCSSRKSKELVVHVCTSTMSEAGGEKGVQRKGATFAYAMNL